MHLRNKLLLLVVVTVGSMLLGQSAPPQNPTPPTTNPPQNTATTGGDQESLNPTDLDTWPKPTPPQTAVLNNSNPGANTNNTANNTATNTPTTNPGTQPTPPPTNKNQQSGYLFKAYAEEVVLHATVVDNKQRIVTNLPKDAFQVYENGQPQTLTTFARQDVPVALGILIDDSGSMRDKRAAVNQAAINLVRASNPQDAVFVVNFNDDYYLDTDYTSDVNKLKEGLEQIDSRGATALYDAIVASADHFKQAPKNLDKKVLVVVTDGEDDASRETLEQAIHNLEVENGPTVYTIGILGDDREARRAKRALQALAVGTGGIAYFPRDLNEVDAISQSIAHDIRSQYVLGYRPTNPRENGGYRTVHVDAHAKGYDKLTVRTRSGYYAGSEQAQK
jgi:Ca-activated chloride channel homolog